MEKNRWEETQLPQEADADVGGGNFLEGLRVLVVDDNQAYIEDLCNELCSFGFFDSVTTYLNQNEGFSFLGKNSREFDIVIASIDMDMGIQFVEFVGQELGLPVIGMCSVENKKVVEVINRGVCVVLMKPLRKEDLHDIWQHVHCSRKCRPHRNGNKETFQGPDRRNGETNAANQPPNHIKLEWNYRLVWTPELNMKFHQAVCSLGVGKATPKKVLELMNVPGLTWRNISSHLQKYRLFLKKNKATAKSDPKDGKNSKSSGAASPNVKPGITINEPALMNTEDTTQRLKPLQMPNLPALTTTDDRLPQLPFGNMYMQPNFLGAESSNAAMQRECIHDQSRFGRPGESTDGALSLSELMITDRGLVLLNQLQEKGHPPEPPVPSYGDLPTEHNPSQVPNGAGQLEMESEDLSWDDLLLSVKDDPYVVMSDATQEIRESSPNWIAPDNMTDNPVTSGTLNILGNSSTTVVQQGQAGQRTSLDKTDGFDFLDELVRVGSNWPLSEI